MQHFQFTRGYNILKSSTFQLIVNSEHSEEILFLSIYFYQGFIFNNQRILSQLVFTLKARSWHFNKLLHGVCMKVTDLFPLSPITPLLTHSHLLLFLPPPNLLGSNSGKISKCVEWSISFHKAGKCHERRKGDVLSLKCFPHALGFKLISF